MYSVDDGIEESMLIVAVDFKTPLTYNPKIPNISGAIDGAYWISR